MNVQHEGIAVQELRPDATAAVTTPGDIRLRAGDPVITYVARNLEPYRASTSSCKRSRESRKFADVSCRHRRRRRGELWQATRRLLELGEHLLGSVTLDLGRTHFIGVCPQEYIRILQTLGGALYLTYPFVLSWSLLEAMACGAPLIVSDTAPVREVVDDAALARRVEFFDVEGLVEAAVESLERPLDSRAAGADSEGACDGSIVSQRFVAMRTCSASSRNRQRAPENLSRVGTIAATPPAGRSGVVPGTFTGLGGMACGQRLRNTGGLAIEGPS